jgi:serine protease Do
MSFHPRLTRMAGELLVLVAACGAGSPSALAQREAESLSASFRKAADRAAPSVVGVRPLNVFGPMFPSAPPGGPIGPGGPFPGFPSRTLEAGRPSVGSGVVVDAARGLILTCEPVVDGSPRVAVILPDGREIETDRIARDPRTELVLLTVDPKAAALKQADWGDSEALREGDWVLSIGRPTGRPRSLSAGIVSATGGGGRGDDGILTDALITVASSGGPLVNLDGKVVGIALARGDLRGRPEGFGHALPSSVARRVASELAEFGRVRRGHLGLTIEPDGAESLDPRARSAPLVVSGVTPGSPAAEAGFRVGDRIEAIDGRPLTELESLSRAVEEAPVGQEFAITIERGGARQEIRVQTRQRPEPGGVSVRPLPPGRPGIPRRVLPRDRARGEWMRPLPPRQPGPIRSEPSDVQPPRQPAPSDRKPEPASRPEGSKPERALDPAPDPAPDLPPALELEPARPPANEPRTGKG